MRARLTVVAASLGFAAALGLAADQPVSMTVRLADFESAEELAKWQVRGSKPKTLWELDTQHATHGKACAKLVTPPVGKGGERWPAVILSGANLPVRDWGPFSDLVFDALNPSNKPVPIMVHTRDPKGARWNKPATVAPGRHTMRIQLDGAAKARPVGEFHFFYSDPTETFTIFVDNLRLETGDLRTAVSELRGACEGVSRRLQPVAAHAGPLMQRLGKARARIDALATQLAAVSRSGDASALLEWHGGVRDTEAELEAISADLAVAVFEGSFAGRAWGYAWTHGVDKVFRADRPFHGQVGGTLRLELAANEYEGVQLVLRSRKPLKGVRVAVSDLKTKGGLFGLGKRRLRSEQVEVLPVGYVNTRKPRYHVDYVGWWPDPLLNFLPSFDLDAGVWQPVWLDVRTRARQRPGVYRGTVTVTADGAEPLRVPIEVTVWDFAVPEEYHFPLAVVFWDAMLKPLYSTDADEWKKYEAYYRGQADLKDVGTGEARRLVEIRRKCHDMILAHHLIPDRIYRAEPPRIDDVKRWRAEGARWFNIIHVGSVRSLKEGQPYPAERKKRILDILADYVPKLEKEGLLDMAYIYGFDEINKNEFAAVNDIFGEIKRRYPTIPLMTTAYDRSYGRDTGLADVVDIWVPLTPRFGASADGIAAARARGDQVWWYICCGPLHPHANWFVEYTAAEHRLIMGFMPHKFGSQGFLHYSMNFWQTNRRVTGKDGKTKVLRNAPFPEPINTGPLTNSDGKSWTDYNGDGLIFYPGPDGPISTIRMKCIRDGLEDYEYLWLLTQRVAAVKAGKRRASAAWLKRAEAALAVNPALVRTLTDYTTDGSAVLAARRELAELLMGR